MHFVPSKTAEEVMLFCLSVSSLSVCLSVCPVRAVMFQQMYWRERESKGDLPCGRTV